MDWLFDFSRQADKLTDAIVIQIVGRALQKLDGKAIAVDLVRLTDP
jgi:hypothetical protein